MVSIMTNQIINSSNYLRTSREFPEDIHQLSVEVNKTYIDIANVVNNRTIGIFPTSARAQNGEIWYLPKNTKFTGLRRVYPFTTAGNIPHGLNIDGLIFTKCSGSYTDGTNWYGAYFASDTIVAAQVTFYITPTNIVIQSGAG